MARHLGCVVAVLVWAAIAEAQPRADRRQGDIPRGDIRRAVPDAARFNVLPAKAELYSGDLLVTLPGAELESKDGAVALKSFADYDTRSPLPILETALILGTAGKGEDLAFTLDRGRVDITNKKARGAAVVNLVVWEQHWIITLDEPGGRVAVELSGRWPAGAHFKPVDPTKNEKPARRWRRWSFSCCTGPRN